MPPKKKKGKASKLARMSDEERARYLQHRADVELEAKRRKQQLIAMYTKNKLRREDVFTRINTAKLNEQWRTTLRQMKSLELKEDVRYLWECFEDQLATKDDFIKRLFEELVETDLDHRRFQEAHMMSVDDIIEKGKERLGYLHNNYEQAVKRIENVEVEDLGRYKIDMKDSILQLKTIIYAKSKRREEELTDIKTKNAANIHDIVYCKEDTILKLKRRMYPKLECLWQQLNEVITNYENLTESKSKQYEYMKEQDDAHQLEAARFPKLYSQMRENAETLRRNLMTLGRDREETIADLRLQSELLTRRACKMRQETKMERTLDALQLKRLSFLSSEVMKELERILEKGEELQTMSKLCSDMEIDTLVINKYSVRYLESPKELIKSKDEPYGFFKKIENFRYHLYCIQDENTIMKHERDNLIEENNSLRHSLRAYLITVSRMPTIRPRTRA